MRRPTEEDADALELLLQIGDIGERDTLFLESLYDCKTWSARQCKWFERLRGRYL